MAADRNGVADVYLRDVHAGTITRVSSGYGGVDTTGPSYHPAISGDGRLVAFVSEADNLLRGGSPRIPQVYVHDVALGTTTLVSMAADRGPGRASSLHPALSHDGSVVAFQSLAALTCSHDCGSGPRDENLLWDVFVHDRATSRTTLVSADAIESWGGRGAAMDARGLVIAFSSRWPSDAADVDDDEDAYVRLNPRGR